MNQNATNATSPPTTQTEQATTSTPALSHALAPVEPSSVRYIKLGTGGSWEKECLQRNIIRIGFGSACPDLLGWCQSGSWDSVKRHFVAEGKDKTTATRFTGELRLFFEDNGTTLWITFMKNRLYWGQVDNAPPTPHEDGNGVWRTIRQGWCGNDLLGKKLSKDRLSGALTKLAAYRGTSCAVGAHRYVVSRINGHTIPEIERAIAAKKEMQASVIPLMRLLEPQDFELLVDLVFTSSGWRRLGVLGKTEAMLDMDLVLPSTGERAFVQVKSSTTSAELAEYVAKLGERADLYQKMFYVYHSGEATTSHPRVTLVNADRLAELVVNAGLTEWLIEKTSR
jgi:hypothetical protein